MPSGGRVQVTIYVRPGDMAALRHRASAGRISVSAAAQQLIEQALDDEATYYRRTSGTMTVLGVTLLQALVEERLGADALKRLQRRSNRFARELFGKAPPRPFEVDLDDPDDPRLVALHDAMKE